MGWSMAWLSPVSNGRMLPSRRMQRAWREFEVSFLTLNLMAPRAKRLSLEMSLKFQTAEEVDF
jgi:hypothetical protein